jgi:hypothetical protein
MQLSLGFLEVSLLNLRRYGREFSALSPRGSGRMEKQQSGTSANARELSLPRTNWRSVPHNMTVSPSAQGHPSPESLVYTSKTNQELPALSLDKALP